MRLGIKKAVYEYVYLCYEKKEEAERYCRDNGYEIIQWYPFTKTMTGRKEIESQVSDEYITDVPEKTVIDC